jgi:alkane 1-monooxygenase
MVHSARSKLVGYPISLAVPLLVPLGPAVGTYWLSPVVMFAVLPILGALVGQDHSLPLVGLRRSRSLVTYLHLLPRLYGLAWVLTVAWAARHADRSELSVVEFTGLVLSVGIASALAVCTAHELLHRRSRVDLGIARLMTAVCFYGHMVVEHLHHHSTLGTAEYGATAKRGTSAYRFAMSDFGRAFVTAWHVESSRLARNRLPLWHHKVLQDYALGGAFGLAIAVLWRSEGVLLFAGQALFAIFSFEVITYVHHYGLVRAADEDAGAHHAWAHHCWITNCLSFNNTFHSDHHLRPWTPYYELHAMHGAPRLPASYFTMFLVALMPMLWFRLMNPRLDLLDRARAARQDLPDDLAAEHCR